MFTQYFLLLVSFIFKIKHHIHIKYIYEYSKYTTAQLWKIKISKKLLGEDF